MGLNTNLRAFSAARLAGVKIPSQRGSKQDRPTLCHGYFKIEDVINLFYILYPDTIGKSNQIFTL